MSAGSKSRRRLNWDEWYRLACDYRDAHGDLLIPRDYVCPSGEKLGRWIERQRGKYNGVASVPGHLDRTQIALLNAVGMVWKLEDRHDWENWLQQLDWYRKTYGDLNIPGDFERGNYHLGNWIRQQRKRRAADLLTQAEIDDLDRRGMLWNVKTRPRRWEDWYADAQAYFRAHGDLRVPPNYLTPDGHRLGTWITRQRDIYMGRKGAERLTPEQVKELEALHMVWDPTATRDAAWDRMYVCVAQYRDQHGKLPLWPRDAKAPDGRSMWGWINTQRAMLAEGRMPQARRERLKTLGIDG